MAVDRPVRDDAIARLLRPSAISVATSASRGVSAPADGDALGVRARPPSADSTASSLLSSDCAALSRSASTRPSDASISPAMRVLSAVMCGPKASIVVPNCRHTDAAPPAGSAARSWRAASLASHDISSSVVPEHTFPAAHDDADAALRWAVAHISGHCGDPTRIALAGDSAGGTLAASAAISAVRDGIELSALLLVYPLVNATIVTASREEFASGYVIELDDLAWFGEQYAGSAEDVLDPRLALDMADLAGLPSTLVITNECDTLRDEGELLASRM